MTGAWRSGPLGIPAFRLLTAGQFTSTLGDYCYAVALPWLVLSGHGSAAALGIILACYGIPRAALTTAMLVFGLVAGFGNVVFITLIQRWAPPAMLGRVMGLVMLAAIGSFPLSTAIAGVLTAHLGPPPVFVISGTLIAAAVLAGLVQRDFRAFGARSHTPDGPAPERSPA